MSGNHAASLLCMTIALNHEGTSFRAAVWLRQTIDVSKFLGGESGQGVNPSVRTTKIRGVGRRVSASSIPTRRSVPPPPVSSMFRISPRDLTR